MALSWMNFNSRPSPMKPESDADTYRERVAQRNQPSAPRNTGINYSGPSKVGQQLDSIFKTPTGNNEADRLKRGYQNILDKRWETEGFWGVFGNPTGAGDVKSEEAIKAGAPAYSRKDTGLLGAPMGTYQLTDEEFNNLSTLQQQAVLANTALNRARRADRGVEGERDANYDLLFKRVFADDDAVEHAPYAPNIVRALDDLGIRDTEYDLRVFLEGLGGISYSQLQSGENEGTLFELLSNAPTFESQEVQASLEKGANLLSALQTSPALTPATRDSLGLADTSVITEDPARAAAIEELLRNMANKQEYEWIKTVPEVREGAAKNISAVIGDLDPLATTQYMLDIYPQVIGDDPNLMTLEEFRKNWLQGGGS